MGKIKDKILYFTLSASGGLAGTAYLSRCSGGACKTCLGCAAPAISILVIAVFNKLCRRNKNNGVA